MRGDGGGVGAACSLALTAAHNQDKKTGWGPILRVGLL